MVRSVLALAREFLLDKAQRTRYNLNMDEREVIEAAIEQRISRARITDMVIAGLVAGVLLVSSAASLTIAYRCCTECDVAQSRYLDYDQER